MDGIVASETANNGTIGGAMIPLLALGIPGDAATAMLLGGLQVHNVAPGPLIYEKNGAVVYAIYFAMVLSAIFMMVFMLGGMRFFIAVLKVPKNYLLPVVVVLCAIGAIGNANMLFDTYCMVAFGLMSYLLIKSKVPTVPMILGFILGPTFEQNIRRVSQLTSSDPFWNHPIFCVLIIATVFVVIFSTRANMKDAKRAQQAELESIQQTAGSDE
jgi:putative tricarboxylic transport membrane protein